MELHERIRDLRKNHLHMSQTEFGERLGVSLSVINNIENNRLARPDQKLSLLKLICKEFSVNEDWLLNGIEPMLAEPETFNLDDFAKEHQITQLETEIIKTYLELDPDIRKKVVDHFMNHLAEIRTAKEDKELSTEELEAEYKKSRSGSASKTASSASSITRDGGKGKASNQ